MWEMYEEISNSRCCILDLVFTGLILFYSFMFYEDILVQRMQVRHSLLKMPLQPGNFPRYIREFSLLYEEEKIPPHM